MEFQYRPQTRPECRERGQSSPAAKCVVRASGAQGLANNARGISMNAYGLPVAWRGRRGVGSPQGRGDTVRAQLGAAESPPPPKSRHQQQGGALATAMLVGRMLLLGQQQRPRRARRGQRDRDHAWLGQMVFHKIYLGMIFLSERGLKND